MVVNNPKLLEKYKQQWKIREIFSSPVEEGIRLYRFQRGEYIYQEGGEIETLYFLVEGRVKEFRTHQNGKVSVVEFSSAFDILGELELVKARSTTIAVQVMQECYCLGLNVEQYEKQLSEDCVFLSFVARRLAQRLGDISKHQSVNTAWSVEVRLARYILFTQNNGRFSERLTEAADYLGVSYRHLQRILARFCEEGILAREHRSYRICDMDALEKLYKNTV